MNDSRNLEYDDGVLWRTALDSYYWSLIPG
jgi:hypothetical protein